MNKITLNLNGNDLCITGLHIRHFWENISSVIQLNSGLKNKAVKLKACKMNIINSSIRKQLLM